MTSKKLLIFTMLIFCIGNGMVSSQDCPNENKIIKMMSDMESYKAVGTLDFSNIVSAGAMKRKDGTKVQVCLSNVDFTIKKMANDLVLPIKTKDQFIAAIKFSNGSNEVVPGTYSAESGYGKPFWVHAEVKLFKEPKGVIVSLGVREGTATITKMTADSICGTFDLKTKADTRIQGAISGTFNCKLETSRW